MPKAVKAMKAMKATRSGVHKTGPKPGGGHYKKKKKKKSGVRKTGPKPGGGMVKAVQIMHSEQEQLSECVKHKCVHETLAKARLSKSMHTKP